MLDLTCLCGRVRLRVASRPDYMHECNYPLCAKAGARWAYFSPADVAVEGDTAGYTREDKAEPGAIVRFCARCGVTTHFTLAPSAIARFGDTMAGVNMRLADDAELAGIELRYPDGRAWSGDGAFGYVRAPRVMGEDTV